MNQSQRRRDAALSRELLAVRKEERKIAQAAVNAKSSSWKGELENKIPEEIYTGLQSTFCKGFQLVFSQGRAIIEKGYNKAAIQEDYAIRNYAVQVRGGRRELKKVQRHAMQADFLNLAATTVEGVGLGALGVGMADILLFLGTLMKGIYETALHYGFDYVSEQEQMLILKMMEASLSTGNDWLQKNYEVDGMLIMETVGITDADLCDQIRKTAEAFAVDMLLLKFIQGIPVVGILGGAANPVYYSKVMKYVQLKYRKRYLMKQREVYGHGLDF